MTQKCQITGKRPSIGHKVSHSNIKTKRRFNINLRTKKFWLEGQKRFIKLRLTTKGIKIIDKVGIDNVLANIAKYNKDIEE